MATGGGTGSLHGSALQPDSLAQPTDPSCLVAAAGVSAGPSCLVANFSIPPPGPVADWLFGNPPRAMSEGEAQDFRDFMEWLDPTQAFGTIQPEVRATVSGSRNLLWLA